MKLKQNRLKSPTKVYSVFGVPLTKREVVAREKNVDSFIAAHAAKVRSISDTILRLTLVDIDKNTQIAFSTEYSQDARSKAAWENLAWNIIAKPFKHPERVYYTNLKPYIDIISKDHRYLYLYGLMIHSEPFDGIYESLKTLHPHSANMYLNYAKYYEVARDKYDLNSLYPW